MDRLRIFGFEIQHSLMRSDSRRQLLLYMKRHSDKVLYKATIYSIAIDTGMSPANVRGAILGNGSGYNKSYSLVSLGLIGYDKRGRYTIYFLTSKGLEVAGLLEELA